MIYFEASTHRCTILLCTADRIPWVSSVSDRPIGLLTQTSWDTDEAANQLDSEALSPVWVIDEHGCSDQRHCDCLCGVVDLSVVLKLLSGQRRLDAIAAHCSLLENLAGHADAARQLASSSSPGRLPDAALCPSCLLRSPVHVEALATEFADRLHELRRATSSCSQPAST